MLPEGIDTSCSVAQELLNAGSIQKTRVARALSVKPSFMFLDEMLSNVRQDQGEAMLKQMPPPWPRRSPKLNGVYVAWCM